MGGGGEADRPWSSSAQPEGIGLPQRLAIRSFGKANFLGISDGREKIQVYIRKDALSERDFIYVTTQHLTHEQLVQLSGDVGPERSLLVMCTAFHSPAFRVGRGRPPLPTCVPRAGGGVACDAGAAASPPRPPRTPRPPPGTAHPGT